MNYTQYKNSTTTKRKQMKRINKPSITQKQTNNTTKTATTNTTQTNTTKQN